MLEAELFPTAHTLAWHSGQVDGGLVCQGRKLKVAQQERCEPQGGTGPRNGYSVLCGCRPVATLLSIRVALSQRGKKFLLLGEEEKCGLEAVSSYQSAAGSEKGCSHTMYQKRAEQVDQHEHSELW